MIRPSRRSRPDGRGPVPILLVVFVAVLTAGVATERPSLSVTPTARRIVAADSFDRPRASSLGTADTGQRWGTAGRGSWRVVRHRAAAATNYRTARPVAFIDARVRDDAVVRARIRLSPTRRRANAALAFHVIDARNYLFAKIEVTRLNPTGLMSIGIVNQGRTRSMLASRRGLGLRNGRTYRVRVVISGRDITMRIRGGKLSARYAVRYRLSSWQQERFGASTRYGLRTHIAPDEDDGRSRWDDFAVVARR